MLKTTKAIAALAMLSTASAASAEAVIVSCNVTSSSMNVIDLGMVTYKIGNGSWLQYDPSSASWTYNFCVGFSYVFKVSCSFAPKKFSVSGYDGLSVGISIDRETGILTAYARSRKLNQSATGTCVPGTEPAPPKTKF
jgi:hypothetical protein